MKNMKRNRTFKMSAVAVVAAMAGVLIISTAAFAAGPGTGIHTPGTGLSADVVAMGSQGAGYGGAYGLADGAGLGFVDADGDGVCDNLGTGQGLSANFVDADGDGVCDNLGTGLGLGGQRGSRMGGGRMGAANAGAGFVDADGDGVCDYLQVAE